MSLRARLVASIALILLAALALGAMVLGWRATNSVQVEMRAALAGADDVVQEALAHQAKPDPAFLSALVAGFNGQRHVRATLVSPPVTLRSRLAVPGDIAPLWFDALIRARSETLRIPLANGVLVLQTDPTNEIAEVWRQAGDAFAIMLLFCGATFVAIYLIVGRSLRFLSTFNAALQEVSDGHYEASLPERGPPEFASLARGFNDMARRLRIYQGKNRELQEQVLTLQEEERAEVARDLHDEVGPYLFAIRVDADALPQLAETRDAAGITERATAIREAVAHIQKHIKAILRQLRPAGVLDFGLQAALDDLIAFWSRRHPDTRFDIAVAIEGIGIDRRTEDVAYRIVQESISNAVRHGRPGRIDVTIAPLAPHGLSIVVADDGSGFRSNPSHRGSGIAGMAERVRALHGSFDVTNGPDGRGVRVAARLPVRAQARHEAEPAS